MTKLNVLRTTGKEKEILEEKENELIHLFITSLDACDTDDGHDLGDILRNDSSDKRFALIVKDTLNSKMSVPALRVSLIKLLKELVNNELTNKSFLISKYQFASTKEKTDFIYTLEEMLLTYFDEYYTDDNCIIITDYRDDEIV